MKGKKKWIKPKIREVKIKVQVVPGTCLKVDQPCDDMGWVQS